MDNLPWLLSLSSLIAFLGNFIVQVTASRLTDNVSIFVFSGLFAGFIINMILLLVCFAETNTYIFLSYSLASIITYFSLSFCYWGFLNLNRTSLRIRILREILHHSSTGLSKDNLLDIYSPRELLNVRLSRLEKAGKIVKTNSQKWRVQKDKSRELFFLASLLAWLRKIIIPASFFKESN